MNVKNGKRIIKMKKPVYLFISLLEGLLSGGYFYLAKRDREPLALLTGCIWLACSVVHGLLGVGEADDEDGEWF